MKNQTQQTKTLIAKLHLLRYFKFKIVELLLVEIAVMSLLGFSLFQEKIENAIILAFLGLLYIMYQFMKTTGPMLKHMKAVENEPLLEFEFLEDEVLITKVKENTEPLKLPYKDILLLLESKKYFFILLPQKMGFVFDKSHFINTNLGAFKIFLNEKKIVVQK